MKEPAKVRPREQIADVTVYLNDVQDRFLNELVEMGIFGFTRADVICRFFDRGILELIEDGHLKASVSLRDDRPPPPSTGEDL